MCTRITMNTTDEEGVNTLIEAFGIKSCKFNDDVTTIVLQNNVIIEINYYAHVSHDCGELDITYHTTYVNPKKKKDV